GRGRAAGRVERQERRLRHDRCGNVVQSEADGEAGEASRGGGRHAARSTGAGGRKLSAPAAPGVRAVLLVAERFDRVEEGGFSRRVKSEEDADGGGERK